MAGRVIGTCVCGGWWGEGVGSCQALLGAMLLAGSSGEKCSCE